MSSTQPGEKTTVDLVTCTWSSLLHARERKQAESWRRHFEQHGGVERPTTTERKQQACEPQSSGKQIDLFLHITDSLNRGIQQPFRFFGVAVNSPLFRGCGKSLQSMQSLLGHSVIVSSFVISGSR